MGSRSTNFSSDAVSLIFSTVTSFVGSCKASMYQVAKKAYQLYNATTTKQTEKLPYSPVQELPPKN